MGTRHNLLFRAANLTSAGLFPQIQHHGFPGRRGILLRLPRRNLGNLYGGGRLAGGALLSLGSGWHMFLYA